MPKRSEDSLDTVWIETLQSVLVHGSFEDTAKALGCSQSTISNRIIKLEGWLGASLFTRDERRAWPNDLAYNFAATAVDLLNQLKEFRAVRPDNNAAATPTTCLATQPDVDPDLEKRLEVAQLKWWQKFYSSNS